MREGNVFSGNILKESAKGNSFANTDGNNFPNTSINIFTKRALKSRPFCDMMELLRIKWLSGRYFL
jgi:hypothetical protein